MTDDKEPKDMQLWEITRKLEAEGWYWSVGVATYGYHATVWWAEQTKPRPCFIEGVDEFFSGDRMHHCLSKAATRAFESQEK